MNDNKNETAEQGQPPKPTSTSNSTRNTSLDNSKNDSSISGGSVNDNKKQDETTSEKQKALLQIADQAPRPPPPTGASVGDTITSSRKGDEKKSSLQEKDGKHRHSDYSTASTATTATATTKTRSGHRTGRKQRPGLEEQDDDDVGSKNSEDDMEEKPGAFPMAGINHHDTGRGINHDDIDYADEEQAIAIEGGSTLNGGSGTMAGQEQQQGQDEDDDLVRAELAPQVFEATEVKVDEPGEGGSAAGTTSRTLMLLVFPLVAVALAVGLIIGLVSRQEESTPERLVDPTGDTAATESPSSSSSVLPGAGDVANTGNFTTTPPTIPVPNPYLQDPAFQAFHHDWQCSNTTNEAGLYVCELDLQRGFPYFHYDCNLMCQCQAPVGADNPATNELCNCDVIFFFVIENQESPRTCTSVSFVNTTTTLPMSLFQIQYDCSNLFWFRLNDAVDQSCVGRDEQGNCFPQNTVPPPPEIVATDIDASELVCFPDAFSTEGGVFEILRGRHQCNLPQDIPFPDTNIRTVLFCQEPDYRDSLDCNCAIFLGELFFELSCQDCQVIPNGSNDTLQIAYDCSDRFVGSCVSYTANGTCIDSNEIGSVCTYYDIASCQQKALELGLLLGGGGFPFAASSYPTKGCYYYPSDHPQFANRAYFGTGAVATSQLENNPNQGNRRLLCDTTVDNPPSVRVCPYLDADACRQVAKDRGLKVGSGGWPFETMLLNVKGCFYFPPTADVSLANAAFFGPGAVYPSEMLTIPSNGALRFFCNVTDDGDGDDAE